MPIYFGSAQINIWEGNKVTNTELIRLWANDEKRRTFLADYKEWGVWLNISELGLVYYKYDLPKGHRILAVEYQRKDSYAPVGGASLQTVVLFYLWEDGDRFAPTAAVETYIADWLMHLKWELKRELQA